MLFQGKEFSEEVVKKAYEEANRMLASIGVSMSFEEWVQYNNDYYVNKEKALDKAVKKASSSKKKRR